MPYEPKDNELELNELRSIFSYDPDTGALYRIARPRRVTTAPGKWVQQYFPCDRVEAGFTHSGHGYRMVKYRQKAYFVHRVGWALYNNAWPQGFIDHLNGDKTDNRACNLRDVAHGKNMRNKKMYMSNTSGVTGVYWHAPKGNRRGYWAAVVTWGGIRRQLGAYQSFEEAVAARRAAEKTLGFTQRHGK